MKKYKQRSNHIGYQLARRLHDSLAKQLYKDLYSQLQEKLSYPLYNWKHGLLRDQLKELTVEET